jgi:hypothetical protein
LDGCEVRLSVICDPCARVRPGVSRVCPGSPPGPRCLTVKRQRGAVGSRDTKKTQEAGSKTPGQRFFGFEQVLQFDTRSQRDSADRESMS